MMLTARWLLDHNPDPTRGRDPRGDLRPDLPLHRLREHRPVGALGGQRTAARNDRSGAGRDRERGLRLGSRRKEDARFIRGQGTFVDDIALPGMLHGAVLRSPLAHARIVSVDATAALAHPQVEAVITGETWPSADLAWMPTLSGDVQAVLATDKVRFQGQEVAFVVASDRYSARDALELIAVEYEPLPAVDRRPDRARPGRAGRSGTTCRAGPATTSSTGRPGDQAATDAVFAAADVVGRLQDMLYPRSHPAPLETCGSSPTSTRSADG